jgi:hypothetical protein
MPHLTKFSGVCIAALTCVAVVAGEAQSQSGRATDTLSISVSVCLNDATHCLPVVRGRPSSDVARAGAVNARATGLKINCPRLIKKKLRWDACQGTAGGTTVTVEAKPSYGDESSSTKYVFDHWAGNSASRCRGANNTNDKNPCTFTPNAILPQVGLSAVFVKTWQ